MDPKQNDHKPLEQVVNFVEEDEFEEFENEDWDEKIEDIQQEELWEQDWDDNNIDDDFSRRLRAELAKN